MKKLVLALVCVGVNEAQAMGTLGQRLTQYTAAGVCTGICVTTAGFLIDGRSNADTPDITLEISTLVGSAAIAEASALHGFLDIFDAQEELDLCRNLHKTSPKKPILLQGLKSAFRQRNATLIRPLALPAIGIAACITTAPIFRKALEETYVDRVKRYKQRHSTQK